jgi:hypothetical protein
MHAINAISKGGYTGEQQWVRHTNTNTSLSALAKQNYPLPCKPM